MNKEIAPVLEEIKAVLKKHDMAGLVIVANRSHCDFVMEIEPSWSCARLETDAEGRVCIRVRSKLADYENKEAQSQELQTTIGTFVTFSDVLDRLNENIANLLVMLSGKVEFLGKSTWEE